MRAWAVPILVACSPLAAAARVASTPPRGLEVATVIAPAPTLALAPPRAQAPPSPPSRCAPEPILGRRAPDERPEHELARLVLEDPARLGSGSIGAPTRGSLFGGVKLESSDAIQTEGAYLWGTELTVRSIERAVREVQRCHPGTPRLHVGDLSRREGGWLRPHRSHQSGLDADVGYYYLGRASWYEAVTAKTLDRPRTWALVRALVEGGNVDMIFIDRSVQALLREYAAEHDPSGVAFFATKPREGIIRHAWGHATHLHVRFHDPTSAALGARIRGLVGSGRLAARAR